MKTEEQRRPLATRHTVWAKSLAASLAETPLTPNHISLLSMVFAALGALLLALPSHLTGGTLLLVALCIQARLLCNLMDGMVAVEGGKASPTGILYNELPDRIADIFLLVGLGCALESLWLGWLAACAAVFTAYVRQTGAALGKGHDFSGIQSKPRRMGLMTFGCLLGAGEAFWTGGHTVLLFTLWCITLGTLLTCVTRTLRLSRALRNDKATEHAA